MIRRLLILFVLCALSAAAQEVNQSISTTRVGSGAQPASKPANISAADRERASQLLESAEGQARGMKDAGSRAFSLLQFGRAYKTTDKKKAVEIFEEALAATRAMDDDSRFRRTRERLQQQVLDELIPLAPASIDDLLAAVDPSGRERVFVSLIRYYNERKETDNALQAIYRMAQEFEVPYGLAANIMSNLSPEQSDDLQQLFTTCLASYRDRQHDTASFGSGDFGTIVSQYYRQVPPSLASQAIDVLLDEARKRARDEAEKGQPTSISLSSAKGAVAFNSYYDYRLFQLLPALRALDNDEAEKLLKERQDVATLLGKYPEGMGSIQSGNSQPGGWIGPGPGAGQGPDRRPGGTSFMVNSGSGAAGRAPGGPGPGGPSRGPSPLEMQKMAKLVEDAAQHPQDSIANAATLTSPQLKVQAYISIARETWKKNSSAAHISLEKAQEANAQLGPDEQLIGLRDIASIYERLGEKEDAKKVIEKGMDVAEKLLKTDTNADDPNQAPKAYWPSTGAYRSMFMLAARISPAWAVSLLKEIPDEDIKALNQIAIANSLLQTRGGSLEIMQFTKNSGRMTISQEDTESR